MKKAKAIDRWRIGGKLTAIFSVARQFKNRSFNEEMPLVCKRFRVLQVAAT
jgi:hypothetical protein